MEERYLKMVISKSDTLKQSILANCKRVVELLETNSLEDIKKTHWKGSSDNVELRQRMAQIRKDSLKIDKYVTYKEDL